MTKADIVSEIAKSTGAEKVQVQAIVEAFMESIKGSLAQNNNVYLRGFGSFIVKKRAKKVARNISKNTTITIPAHRTERNISVTRWRPTSVKNVFARIVTRKSR